MITNTPVNFMNNLQLTQEQWAYVAGVVEMSSGISVIHHDQVMSEHGTINYKFAATVNITNRDLEFMNKLAQLLNQNVVVRPKYKNINNALSNGKYYLIHIKSPDLITFLKNVLPYIKTHKEEIEIGIEFRETFAKEFKKGKSTEELTEIRTDLMLRMQDAKIRNELHA